MEAVKIIFFGTTDDSVLVLEKILNHQPPTLPRRQAGNNYQLISSVTQPPRPSGRHGDPIPTPVESFAKMNHIPVLTFASDPAKPWQYQNETEVTQKILDLKPDLLITACYGQKIPTGLISRVKFGGINIHPSLLPRWRGADPIPWTILSGDKTTGATLVTLSEKFDQGQIIGQNEIEVSEDDFPDPLRTKLFEIGADLLVEKLANPKGIATPTYREKLARNDIQIKSYARKLTRDDGFVPWNLLIKSLTNNNLTIEQCSNLTIVKDLVKYDQQILNRTITGFINNLVRAFTPWPGVWTILEGGWWKVDGGKSNLLLKTRLKILKTHLENNLLVIDQVQLEGKKPVDFKQFKTAYPLFFPSAY